MGRFESGYFGGLLRLFSLFHFSGLEGYAGLTPIGAGLTPIGAGLTPIGAGLTPIG